MRVVSREQFRQWRCRLGVLLNRVRLDDEPRLLRVGVRMLQILRAVYREFVRGELSTHAMGLVYTTLFSMVPLLAVSFSVLKAFGVRNLIEPLLLNFLEPLGEQRFDITAQIVGFVENVRVGVLGFLGLVFLFYTVVSLLQKIEQAFNHIWRISRVRPLARRFSDYLSVVLIGPVLVFSALGITASMVSTTFVQELIAVEPFGTLFYFLGQTVPYLLIIAAFAFVYIFIPNTRVALRPALLGAAVAGVGWKTAGWAFALFVAGSTKYDAIYSGFAILIVFLIWLYASWIILLIGAQISFFLQRPQYLIDPAWRPALDHRLRERLGLNVMFRICKDFYDGTGAPDIDRMAADFAVPGQVVEDVVDVFKKRGLVVEVQDREGALVPGKSLVTMTVNEVLTALRESPDTVAGQGWPATDTGNEVVNRLMQELEDVRIRYLGALTMKELLARMPHRPSAAAE